MQCHRLRQVRRGVSCMPQKLEIFDSTVWAERALLLCRRKIHDEDILKALRHIDGKSSEDVNNRPLIGVLSQVRGHPVATGSNDVLRTICADHLSTCSLANQLQRAILTLLPHISSLLR